MSQCKKFAPNIFHKTKCSNCFRQKEEHSAEALECNRASRSIARSGYLFVAPDWDFSVPLNRTKRWQRRWFVLYDDGELNYSVDEHPDTVPQGSVDMSKVLEVTGAEQVTGHPHSLALTSPDRVTFVKAASREDARWWAELLAVFPRRHKRNATFPGGRASPSLPQLGRSASPQPPRPRHLSCTGPSPRANFETPPLKEERESPPKDIILEHHSLDSGNRPDWVPTENVPIETGPSSLSLRNDYIISSGSPPTRDKLRCDDKARARRDWRNERLRDIATALTDRSPESSLALPAESLLHLKKGWLWLQQDGDLHRRWVVLSGPALNIYHEQDEQGTPEIAVELSTVSGYTEVPTDSKYGFEINWSGPTLVLSAVTAGIRANWLQALKKAANLIGSNSPTNSEGPGTPTTPRSGLLSSDEEYRTASEGGRRGSEDWGVVDLPPSPPLTNRNVLRNNLLNRDRTSRMRPRLPRCQSRQSTLDSTSTDELDCVKFPDSNPAAGDLHFNNALNRRNGEITDLQNQLDKSLQEVRSLEEEIARLKKFQAEAVIQEKKAKEMMLAFERTEKELNQRNSQAELKFLKEQRVLQRRLLDAEELVKSWEDKSTTLGRDLQTKQRLLLNLQEDLSTANERLARSKDDNEKLFRRIKELESRRFSNNKHQKILHVDSLTDLTNVDLDLDIDELGQNELKEYCLDLRGRFEKAVLEIRAVKRELRESYEKSDNLEIENYGLENKFETLEQTHRAELGLMVSRLEHVTAKLSAAEKQMRIKSKAESRDKRRSLSLKGRESFSINKEVEDKVTELEAKILALERGKSKRKYKRDRSSERNSPIDDKSLRRLRRKSLDSATSSEPMKLLIRLSTLESQVSNANISTESLNTLAQTENPTPKSKLDECLCLVVSLKNALKSRTSSAALFDRLSALEKNLLDLGEMWLRRDHEETISELGVVNSSANSVVSQLQSLLAEKLSSLNERKRVLRENGKLDVSARLEILAEKFAFENILVARIQEALNTPATGDIICHRLVSKETAETAGLIGNLRCKLNGSAPKQAPNKFPTSVDHLSKILAKCLMSANKNRGDIFEPQGRLSVQELESLTAEQKKIGALFERYKAATLPQLAEVLALESMSLPLDGRFKEDFSKMTADMVNYELVQGEINHVFQRAAQVYQSNLNTDSPFFFSFFASERAALELWSDAVAERLSENLSEHLTELSELYKNQLNKLQRQNWRRRLENERTRSSSLLQEFADVVAHKCLVDARMDVLTGRFRVYLDEKSADCNGKSFIENCLEGDFCWDCLENQDVQINQSLQAEFSCMLDRSGRDCFGLVGQPELDQVLDCLSELQEETSSLMKSYNLQDNSQEIAASNWADVCLKCKQLKAQLEQVRQNLPNRNNVLILKSPSLIRLDSLSDENRISYHQHPGAEYLTLVENLRAAYRCALASCKERHQEHDIEQLQTLCERVLVAMEQWHRRAVQEMREQHSQELESLRVEKEQALAEETQATLAALDAMRKAHEAEVQREVAKFKQEFARQQRDDIMDMSERLSVKCLEAAALEEQLGSATRQLTHAQQHILQLERNPQLSTMQN